jgi:hypothetical protein
MAEKNPLDEIVDELVVFKHEDINHPQRYVSNSPLWNDSRLRKRWMDKFSDEAIADSEGEDDIEDVEGDDYETWRNDDLRAELASRELSVEGTKKDLVARLREDDSTAKE